MPDRSATAALDDEDLLLAVLNSAPVIDGVKTDLLGGTAAAELVARFGGTGTPAEQTALRKAREALHGVIRGEAGAHDRLAALLTGVSRRPELSDGAIDWRLQAPANARLAARAVLAWARVQEQLPGRLRACANTECNLFLVDHSRPGTAKWCSMATCGNRMKARAHARRARSA